MKLFGRIRRVVSVLTATAVFSVTVMGNASLADPVVVARSSKSNALKASRANARKARLASESNAEQLPLDEDGHLMDGMLFNDLPGQLKTADESAPVLTASIVDEFGNVIGEKYDNIAVPVKDGLLVLDNPDEPPVKDVFLRSGLFGMKKLNYHYLEATADGSVISAVRLDPVKEPEDEQDAEDAGRPTVAEGKATGSDAARTVSEKKTAGGKKAWFYTENGSDWEPVTEDTELLFVYAPDDRLVFEYEDEDVIVRAAVEKENSLPKGAELLVTPVTRESSEPVDRQKDPVYNYQVYLDALNRAAEENRESGDYLPEYTEAGTLFYDIAFLAPKENGFLENLLGGEQASDPENLVEFQPEEGAVRLTFTFKKDQLKKQLGVTEPGSLKIHHLPLKEEVRENVDKTSNAIDITAEDVEPEILEAAAVELEAASKESGEKSGETVEFVTESFSVYAFAYTVDFAYSVNGNTYEYTLPGGGSVRLSELIRNLGMLNGTPFENPDAFLKEVERAEFSDTSLVKVTRIEGDWELASLASFETEESLTVTMRNGDVVIVKVTDAEQPGILVDIKDYNGEPASIGGGFVLSYYELPEATLNAIQQQTIGNPDDYASAEEYFAAVRAGYAEMMRQMDKYKTTLTINQSGQRLGYLNMEAGASADNPYQMIFTTGMEPEFPPDEVLSMVSTKAMMTPFSTKAAEYMGSFSLTYDGNTVTKMTGMTKDADGNLHGTVFRDTTLVQAAATVKLDASEYMEQMTEGETGPYPVYVKALLMSMTQRPVINPDGNVSIGMGGFAMQVVKAKASTDGTVALAFPDKVNAYTGSTPGPMYSELVVGLYADADCTKPVSGWNLVGDYGYTHTDHSQNPDLFAEGVHAFAVGVGSDGVLKMMNLAGRPAITNTDCEPEFVKNTNVFRASVNLGFLDPGGFTDQDQFPLYAKLTLTGQDQSSGTSLSQDKIFEIPAVNSTDSTGNVKDPYQAVFDTRVSKTAQFTVKMELYQDEACTLPAEGWDYSDTLEFLTYSEEQNCLVENDAVPELVANYNLVDTAFDFSVFSTESDMDYPAYVKFTLMTEGQSGENTRSEVLTFTGDGHQTIDLKKVIRGWGGAEIRYAAYTDQACTNPHPYWNSETSISGYLKENGQFWSYDKDNIVDTFSLSHVSSDSLVVPMDVEQGTITKGDTVPVYIKATLTGPDGVTPVTIKKRISSLTAANTTLEFHAAEGETFVSSGGDDYRVEYAFYKDEDCTEPNEIWPAGHFTADMTKNRTLTYNGDAAGIHLRQLKVKVDPEAYELTVDSSNPVYIKVTAWNGNGTVIEKRETRNNLEAFEVTFDRLSYSTPFSKTVSAGEQWQVKAVVCEDAVGTAPAAEWKQDEKAAVMTVSNGLQTEEEHVSYTMSPRGGTNTVYTYEYVDTVLMPEYVKGGVKATLPVHINIPETNDNPFLWRLVKPGYAWQQNYDEALHLRLYRKGTDGYYHYWEDDRSAEYGYSYHWIRMDELDAEERAEYDLGLLPPGTYYLGWYMGTSTQYSDSSYKRDPQWIAQDDPVKITVTEDGQILDEAGTPYVAEVYMKEDYKKGVVNPLIDVEFTPHEGYAYSGDSNDINKDNPYKVEFTLKPLWEDAEPEFTYGSSFNFSRFHSWPGRSYLSTFHDYYQYNYKGDRTVPRTLGWLESGRLSYDNYSYNDKEVYVGWPVGDYELSYGVVDDYITNDYYERAVQGYSRYWYKDTVKVHLAEDGSLYKINEDGTHESEPYYIDVRYLSEAEQKPNRVFDYLTVKVNTRINEGITEEQAFSEGETFRATLCTYRWREGNYTINSDIVGYGDARISETGETTVRIYGLDGGPIGLPDDTVYELYYGTYTDTTEINGKSYPIYSNRWVAGLREWPLIDENGVLYISHHNYQDNTDSKEELVLDNYSLLVPWQTVDPKEVRQAEEGPVFKPLTDLQQFQDKGSYMVVVQNQFDNSWYALAADEKGGYQVRLEDVHSLSDLKAGYKLDEASGSGSFVLTASKVKQAEESVQLQLKSGVKDDSGKALSLKMGTSSTSLNPLFSGSAGTLIVRNMKTEDTDAPTFQIWKSTYAVLNYVHELFGLSGFGTIRSSSGRYSNYPSVGRMDDYFIIAQDNMYLYGPGYEGYDREYGYVGQKPSMDTDIYPDTYGLMRDEYYLYLPNKEYYTTDQYKQTYQTYLNSISSMPGYYLSSESDQYSSSAPDSINYYILTDVEEPKPVEENNTYTLVKTFGDFYNTFVNRGGSSATMLLVYKDEDGNEYALNPKGAVRVQSREGSNGYSKIIAGAENELIPDNNSGTSSTFSYELADVMGSGEQVFSNPFALRKSRLNSAADVDYVTLSNAAGESAWTKKDDAEHGDGLVYVMQPTNRVLSQSDWDTVETYKLRVIRYGETAWLGIEQDETGKPQMVVVNNEEDALELYVYAPVLTRYYSSAYGSDFYRYYRVNSLEEINAGDELLIVYNDGEKRYLAAYSLSETSGGASAEYGWSSPFAYPALEVLDSYSTINIRDDELPDDARYMYRLDTEGQEKKPYAYFDADNADLIWAQGVASNAVGTAKKESKTQRKYESVTPLGNQTQYMYLKNEKYPLYHREKGEVNFLNGDEEGLFVLRGGKTDAYLGTKPYQKSELNFATGRFERTKEILSFDTISTSSETPAQFEIYKKANTDQIFTIEYYDQNQTLDLKAERPQESITLVQKQDLKVGETDYVFVGWTAEPDSSGLLSIQDSANLFDYEDIPKRAAVKPEVLSQYHLLGDCDPDADNIVSYSSIENYVRDNVLKLYPVYAVRGFSQVVTANETDGTMIVGISDFKDRQMGGDGTADTRERWLGSINIEVYKDGELWVPGGSSTTARKRLMAAGRKPVTATLYFAYHNDNAADLNIKFIAEEVTKETLYDYLAESSLDSFTSPEPTEKYVIDAVYAEQGGSEDGLKHRYNWLDKVVGGQLDNVRGGSTVKIFVTTKYQVRYYLDQGKGKGYEELTAPLTTDQTWTNPDFYTTAGTENAVNRLKESDDLDYLVMKKDDDEEGSYYRELMDQMPSASSSFTDDNLKRGDYSVFLYKFDEYEHVIPIAELPSANLIPAGRRLEDNARWVIRGSGLEELEKQAASSQLTVTETTYGTGNSVWSYKGAKELTNTYHLYAKTVPTRGEIEIQKRVAGSEETEENGTADDAFGFELLVGPYNAEDEDSAAEDHQYPAELIDASGTPQEFREGFERIQNEEGSFLKYVFSLKADEKLAVHDLPVGVRYSVVETERGEHSYEPVSFYETGETSKGETAYVLFINCEQELTKAEVQKIWDDGDSPDRPEAVSVILRRKAGSDDQAGAEGTAEAVSEIYGEAVTLSDSRKWSHTWQELPVLATASQAVRDAAKREAQAQADELKEDASSDYLELLWNSVQESLDRLFGLNPSDRYVWTVEEVTVEGYTSAVTSDETGMVFTITNTKKPEDPTPEKPTPTPEKPTPTPEKPTPTPEKPTPQPENPTPTPENPTPTPEKPTPTPEKPTPTPEKPTPQPENPSPQPENPTPTPSTPTRSGGGSGGGGSSRVSRRNPGSPRESAVLGANRETEGEEIIPQVLGAGRLPKTGEEKAMKQLIALLFSGLMGLLMLGFCGLLSARSRREEETKNR